MSDIYDVLIRFQRGGIDDPVDMRFTSPEAARDFLNDYCRAKLDAKNIAAGEPMWLRTAQEGKGPYGIPMDELATQQQEAADLKLRDAWMGWKASRPHWGAETFEAYAAGVLDSNQSLAEKERIGMLKELLAAIRSGEIYRDPLGNIRWGDDSDGEPNPPGPSVGAQVVDLIHALAGLPK